MSVNYTALRERMELHTLNNGLRICWIPKEGFSKTFAILATRYGSVDQSFSLDGKRYDTPAGVAHFLEHKMFEDEDGNALQKFAKTGASPNAFTSQVMTAYHFSCTNRFTENLSILLKFVFTPYFTEENVQKERGIIAQEIGMMNDTPSWRSYMGLFQGLYRTHPVRVPIAGNVESIGEITPEILYTCHRAFYSPCNMALVVFGTADFDEICRLAEKYSPKQSPVIGKRLYGERRDIVHESAIVNTMNVSQPQFLLGFRDQPLSEKESYLRRGIAGDLAVRLLCGDTSELYTRLYEKGLINRNFSSDYMLIPEGATALFGGESRDPQAVRKAIEQEIIRLAQEGVDEKVFARMKKAVYGLYLRILDAPELYARQEVAALFHGEHYPDFAALTDTIGSKDVQAMYARWALHDRSCLSLVLPQES